MRWILLAAMAVGCATTRPAETENDVANRPGSAAAAPLPPTPEQAMAAYCDRQRAAGPIEHDCFEFYREQRHREIDAQRAAAKPPPTPFQAAMRAAGRGLSQPEPSAEPAPAAPVSCTSRVNGNLVYTNCY